MEWGWPYWWETGPASPCKAGAVGSGTIRYHRLAENLGVVLTTLFRVAPCGFGGLRPRHPGPTWIFQNRTRPQSLSVKGHGLESQQAYSTRR